MNESRKPEPNTQDSKSRQLFRLRMPSPESDSAIQRSAFIIHRLPLWNIATVACLVIAAVFLFFNRIDATFVTATLGVLAWFVNLRQTKFRPAYNKTADGASDEQDDSTHSIDEEREV